MEQGVQKQVQARIEELPEDVQKAIMAADLDRRIQAIGNKHHLHIDQIGKLEDETLLVMLAFTAPSDFASHIQNKCGMSQADAEALATEISNEIFMPIRKSRQDFVEQKSLLNTLTEETTQPQAVVSTVPSTPARTAPSVSAAPTPAPATTPPAAQKPSVPPAGAPAPASKPQVPLAPHPHDLMLVEKPVTTPATPPKPDNYKSDPYREPVEP